MTSATFISRRTLEWTDWKCRFLACSSCQEGGPVNQAPWWKAACSCWTATATASRTIPRGTTTTPSCPWTGCDSGGCCVTSCFMSPTKKSRLTKWCWHPVAHTSTPCLQVSSACELLYSHPVFPLSLWDNSYGFFFLPLVLSEGHVDR